MVIRYSAHSITRLQIRKIAKRDIEWVLANSANRYYDVVTGNLIAVAQRRNNLKNRWLLVAYQEIFGEVWVITAHPISQVQIQNRVHTRRWLKI